MKNKDYYEIEGINYSTLKYLIQSDAQYLHALETKFTPTKAMIFGSAVHEKLSDAINKTDNFDKKYIEINELDYFDESDLQKRGFKNTKVYKDKIKELSKNREIVTPLNFVNDILSDENIKNWCKNSEAEKEYFLNVRSKENINEVLKCKLDVTNLHENILIDWKTTNVIPTQHNMRQVIMNYSYWLQASYYSYLLQLSEKKDFRFIFVFIQNTDPYEFNYIEVPGSDYFHMLKPLINRAILLKNGKAKQVKKELDLFEMPYNPIQNINLEI